MSENKIKFLNFCLFSFAPLAPNRESGTYWFSINISGRKEEAIQGKEGGKKDIKEGRKLKEHESTTYSI